MMNLREQILKIIIIIVVIIIIIGSRDSTVGIASGYGLDGRGVGVRVLVVARFFSSSRRPNWFWGPPSLLYNGYRCFFPGGKTAGV
jgi:hypothetical protein